MKHDNFNQQRGVALFIAIFALLLLSAIALGMMYMANSETDINANYRVSQQLYNDAWAGINEARSRLAKAPGAGAAGEPAYIAPPITLPVQGANTGVVYIFNPTGLPGDNIQPESTASRAFDDELCHENFTNFPGWTAPQGVPCPAPPFGPGWYAQVPSTSPLTGTPQALPYKWARITLKANNSASPDGVNYLVTSPTTPALNATPICWDGTKELTLPAGYATCNDDPPPPLPGTYLKSVYMVTSLAVASNGNARRMMQTEVALAPPFITNSAIDTNDFVNTSGSSLTVNGFDNCACNCPIAKGSAIPTCTNRVTGAPCAGNTWGIFTSKTVTSSGSPAIVSGNCPPGGSGACATAQNQPFPYNVDALITSYKTQPDVINVADPLPPGPQPPQPAGNPNYWSANGWKCSAATGANTGGSSYPQTCIPDASAGYGYGWTCAAGSCTAGSSTFGAQPSPWPPPDPNNVWPSTSAGCTSNCFPPANADMVTYIPGNVTLASHSTGSGVLIVDGNLTANGGISYDGLILVKGTITLSGGGAGQNDNILGAVLSGNGSVADNLKGSYNIQFDRCALARNKRTAPPQIIVAREISY